MKAIIVLPTYNESESIEAVITQLQSSFKKINKHNMGILVVDDNSPDGTSNIVKKLQKKYKNLYMIMGQKQGLGVAYLRGFKHAIGKLKAEVLLEMDADLSHPPEMIPDFMKQIDEGYDFIIGSRYIPGGDTPDWPLKRKMISKGGNFFARVLSGLYKVHDCTSGYRAIRVSSFEKINLNDIKTKGYGFQITILHECYSTGAKIKEIPLVFYDRKYGQSKIRKEDIIEFFFNAFKLRIKSMKRLIKFGIVGGSGIFVNLGIFAIAKNVLFSIFGKSNLTLLGSSLIGDEISIILNFILNHLWTFKGNKNKDNIFKKVLKFHVVAIASVFINNAVLFALYKGFGMDVILAKLIGILVAFMWNYFANVKWTWKEKS